MRKHITVFAMCLLLLTSCGNQKTVADESKLNHDTDITVTVQAVTEDTVTAEIENHRSNMPPPQHEFEFYDKEFKLQQKIDGVWYDLERDDDEGVEPAYSNYVPPQKSVSISYDATIYGGLR